MDNRRSSVPMNCLWRVDEARMLSGWDEAFETQQKSCQFKADTKKAPEWDFKGQRSFKFSQVSLI